MKEAHYHYAIHPIGVSNENRTHDSGITTRGFATKLWTPYKNTPRSQTLTFYGHTNLLGTDVFLYGRGTENRTLIYGLKARYFSR